MYVYMFPGSYLINQYGRVFKNHNLWFLQCFISTQLILEKLNKYLLLWMMLLMTREGAIAFIVNYLVH